MKALLKQLVLFNTAMLGAITVCNANATAATLEPGEWKVNIQSDMSGASIPGLPGLKMPTKPAMTYNWCYKPEPGKDLGQTLADEANRNKNGQKCEMLENKTNGNNVHYKMQCSGQNGTATIDGDFIVNGKTYSGKTHAAMQSPIGSMQIGSTVTGEYMGPCKAQPQKNVPPQKNAQLQK